MGTLTHPSVNVGRTVPVIEIGIERLRKARACEAGFQSAAGPRGRGRPRSLQANAACSRPDLSGHSQAAKDLRASAFCGMMTLHMTTNHAALVESIALRVEAAGLAAPAIAFLEMNRPLAFAGSQALLVAQPLLSMLVAGTGDLAALLEDRAGVDLLIERLERGPGVRE